MTVTAREFLAMSLGSFIGRVSNKELMVILSDLGKKLMLQPKDVAEVFFGSSDSSLVMLRNPKLMAPTYHTKEGAKEFAKYYTEVINEIYMTARKRKKIGRVL